MGILGRSQQVSKPRAMIECFLLFQRQIHLFYQRPQRSYPDDLLTLDTNYT